MSGPVRVAILISGGGSNMVRLVEDMAGDHPARPVLVAADDPDAPGLARAAALGIPVAAIDRRAHSDRAAFEAALRAALEAAGPDLIALAGFMRVLSPGFVARWPARILNVHPSLLPRHPGLDTHARALAAGRRGGGRDGPRGHGRARRGPDPGSGARAGTPRRHARHAGRARAGGRAPALSGGPAARRLGRPDPPGPSPRGRDGIGRGPTHPEATTIASDIVTITDTDALRAFCERAAAAPYVTVDTEFLRERTYWAKLCLVQLAFPGDGETDAVLVDPLADGLDLAPLYDLLRAPGCVKVFHAARQDLEIFAVEGDTIPAPLFDTQVAAMVCGFGEQVGYETLARKVAQASIDKSSRFTDWSRRPLSDAQKAYALADVTHLRTIYEALSAQLAQTGRTAWVEEEMDVLRDPATYRTEPREAWRRLRTRNPSPRLLAIARELAAFRETYAQANDVPRTRVYKDDALLELAALKPSNAEELGRARLLLREARRGAIADGILAAVAAGLAVPKEEMPAVPAARARDQANGALADLLRVLLKAKAEGAGVASKLLATASDLDDIASGDRDGPWAQGWRREVFGEDALRLCEGRIALGCRGRDVRIVPIDD